jgi:FtsH-binding integral membrane protein
VLYQLFGEEGVEGPFALRTILRKVYSIVAFALVGFIVNKALPPTPRPALRAALIVAIFSGFIEIAQKLNHATEGLLSNAIDIACGALGGWLGVAADRLLRRRRA